MKTWTSATSEGVAFRRKLSPWYRTHGRHSLPWRVTRDPYAILVSEVMLQQTQVERVLSHYHAWLERWPDFESLAASQPAEVIRQWRGLGYNRRALSLQRLAVEVVANHSGALPAEARALRALPGVGPYTASAIACFARKRRVPLADTNIARVVARSVLGAANQREVPVRTLTEACESLLPARNARDHNLALMDLGAMVCSARRPKCDVCPVRGICGWRSAGYPEAAAVAAPAPKFETTARFARGRIVEMLRETPATEEEIASGLPAQHRPEVVRYLAALARDGMVSEAGGKWSLPGPFPVYAPNR